ncbi:MAG TPA: Fic family protein [Chloroflexota bacterium]|nr:Fic family protein [Chloroflexota bacterium]HUM71095.1 Fic family protein [Chloroflexota bacterium]
MATFQPRYQISPPLLAHIKQITLLIHELNKRTWPEVVLAQFQAEADAISTYASTSIEGNPLALTEVKRLLKNQPAQVRQSEREVLNYNQALLTIREAGERPLTTPFLLEIHRLVMDGLLPVHQCGQFRREPVIVHDPRTQEIIYLPPDHADVPELVAELLDFAGANQTTLDAIILAGLFHKQLVLIHPFMDGNGRTTRLATKRLLAGLGVDTFNLFSFENYYNRNVSRYFQQVGVLGNYYEIVRDIDYTPWLEYFAEGILDELRRVEKQIERHQASPDTALQPYHRLILDYLDHQGFITDKIYATLTDRAKATRTMDFNWLIEQGYIVRLGQGRSTFYRRLN